MRRVRVGKVAVGLLELEEREAHHARDVLRMGVGEEVEVFDDGGRVGVGRIESVGKKVVVRMERVEEKTREFEWWVATAVPKGNRGDWMVEKLSELGTSGFVPLIAERSVVKVEGKNKLERWERIAGEAAKQSRRRGVMKIGEVTEVGKFVREMRGEEAVGKELGTQNSGFRRDAVWYLSVEERAKKIGEVIGTVSKEKKLTLMIGPEGGWTAEEIAMFDGAGLTGVRMGGSILRVETAAVAAAAIVAGIVVPELNH